MLDSLDSSVDDIHKLIKEKTNSTKKITYPEWMPRNTNSAQNLGRNNRAMSMDKFRKENEEVGALNLEVIKMNLTKEFRDPGNAYVVDEIGKLMSLNQNLKSAEEEFEAMKRSKSLDDKKFNQLTLKESELSKQKYTYNYKSYLNGLASLVDNFIERLPKTGSNFNSNNVSMQQSIASAPNLNNSMKNMSLKNLKSSFTLNKSSRKINSNASFVSEQGPKSPSKNNIGVSIHVFLENLYKKLGHEVYSKLISVFEKYCFYGKTHTNFSMDFQQFSTFMAQNEINDEFLTKTQGESIFNRVRKENKLINFEEFISVLIQFSQTIFSWEKDEYKSFQYFVEQYLVNIPCLNKSLDEKNLERWYFFLESKDFTQEIKKHLPKLHKVFNKYKVRDLRLSECINTEDFLKMSKDCGVIPVFLSSKEIVTVINFVKYRKKCLYPTGNFNFCSFVEALCVIALHSFDKFVQEDSQSKPFDHTEKLRNFFGYINDKV